MNNKLRMVLKKKYEAEIEDAKYKIECFSQQELIIPEHPDITGEVDKLLAMISSAEDKLAVMSYIMAKMRQTKKYCKTSWNHGTLMELFFGLRIRSIYN